MTLLSYPCPPLDGTKSQFRLLEIHPQPDSSLQYSLRTFDIKNSPPYIALSYTWGDDEPANTIAINGQALKIRDNLSYALPRLASLRRDGNKSEFQRDEKYFWIDAICIDQEDTKERNHQVSMMKDIFATASLTVAWLGPEDDDLQSLTWSSMEKIACKEYFERMWIVQEILLSQDVWVICGSGICAWQTLQDYWMIYFDISKTFARSYISKIPNSAAIDPMNALHSIMGSRLMHKEGQVVRLDDLVHFYFDRKCRDPRDRIYALLGLLPPEALQSSPIPVDYNVSLEALFLLVRKHFHLHKRRWRSRMVYVSSPHNYDYAGDLQKALGITTALRFQCESRLIEEGFFRQM
ncbi:hypothetical protein G7054_g509 [Neopestalotiopsis clavispora]|nr:hypothetical protein G7054_g509 [Neopestalotiopsis clavispora]